MHNYGIHLVANQQDQYRLGSHPSLATHSDLRRTFATHAHAAGVDFESVRKAMNHKSGGSITTELS